MAGTHGDQVPEMVIGVVIIDFPMAMGSVVEVDMAMAADVVVVVVAVVVIGVDQDRKEGDIKFKFIIFSFNQAASFFLKHPR